jgi:hypothetical protein
MLAHVGATRILDLRHITVFSSALHIRISATAGPAQILLQTPGTVTAVGSAMAGRPRVIVALPDWTEGSLVANWLSENQFEPVHRSTMEAAASEIRTRPFNLIIADASWAVSNAFRTPDRGCNTTAPNILIGDATDRRATAMDGQAMYLTRPIELAVLSCFVSMALMEDRPVRRSPRKTVQRFDALVNGEPAAIIDVSAEGFRLELPRTRRLPPPYFGVRIPLVGVAIIASRRWAMSPSKDASKTWCGAALSYNRSGAEEVWRSFVDTVPIAGRSGVRVNL